ncbi:MAG: C39 family peptidase [Candidatus Eremiobacteraeota bacterium]|nr:C39 family peptidase [Candidatus Eremiobacteraeota bacterium]
MRRSFLCFFILMALATTFAAASEHPDPLWRPWMGPGDSLVLLQGPSAFKEGTFEGTRLLGAAVKLTAPSWKDKGYYMSPVIRLPRQALWVIPSWNIKCSGNEGWLVEVRVRSGEGELSPWLLMGSGGSAAPVIAASEKGSQAGPKDKAGPKGQEAPCSWAKADIDNIKLTKPVKEVQYRVTLMGKESSPALTLFALAFRINPPVPDSELAHYLEADLKPLQVPYRSQHDEEKDLSSRVCCPTSTAMVLQYLGVNRPTSEIASLLYNKQHDIYGTWWMPPQAACQLGLRGWVQIFSTWEEVQKVIAQGQPIIASISYGEGELRNAPASSSKGHLTVVTGFDGEGRVLVNDPAGKDASGQPMAYDRKEFGKAWFLHGGVGIILKK